MLKSLPNRPLRESEVEAIREAGDFTYVAGLVWMWGEISPFEDEFATEDVVIVGNGWYGLVSRSPHGWEWAVKGECEEGEDSRLLHMVAAEQVGLAE